MEKRNQNPVVNTLNHMRAITPDLRYTGGDFVKWQEDAGKKLMELLGISKPEKCDDDLLIEYDKETDNWREIRFTFQSEKGYYIPGYFLIPKGADKPLPTVICLQGHTSGMHISIGRPIYACDPEDIAGGDRDFAVSVIKRGMCALVIEQRGMGECGGDKENPTCHVHTMANLLIGRTTIGERVWDISRAIDVMIKNFPQADKDNIICLGNSGGGTATFYAACIDKRIKTAIPSCCFASYDDSIAAMHHCTCNFIPGIRNHFDMGDLGGLIAPRNLIIVSGRNDKIFPVESAKEQYKITESLYVHTNGICRHIIGDEGHRFYCEAAWRAYDEIAK